MAAAWCRSCGVSQDKQQGACSACGVELDVSEPPSSSVGLAFESRGVLGLTKKIGICIGSDDGILLIHHSSKEKEYTKLPQASANPAALIDAGLSPASRLLQAAAASPKGASWNVELLRQLAAEMCRDLRVARRLYDEALEHGWTSLAEWVELSGSEKAWRTAHFESARRGLPALRAALSALPSSGYLDRGALLLPHLAAIRAEPEVWRPVLESADAAGATYSTELRMAATGSPQAVLEKCVGLLPETVRVGWTPTLTQLASGVSVPPPPDPSASAWTAVSLISSADGANVDAQVAAVAGVPRAILDDLIDQQRLSAAAPLSELDHPVRPYLLARLDSRKLTVDELREVGHWREFARRAFLERDRATLLGLHPADPRVAHYQALLDVVLGGTPDPARLEPTTVAKLALPEKVRALITAGEKSTLPDELVDDPSLWPMFADLAVDGKLIPDAGRPAAHPLNTWIGLQLLLGLVWSGRFGDAVDHGRQLSRAISDEVAQDEVANLTGFALDQLGRHDEALDTLSEALEGLYTENLLVNVSIVASKVDPATGVSHLARLVDEAPTQELRRAGMDQALSVWSSSDQPFPQVLIPHLDRMLSQPTSMEEFLHLSKVAAKAVPSVARGLPSPGGQYAGAHQIMVAKARFEIEDDFYFSDLADAYIDVYQTHGYSEWWDEEWKSWKGMAEEALFVDFGKAVGVAEFVLTVLNREPRLLTQRERFVMAPEAGAHLAALLETKGAWLSDDLWSKCFFNVMNEFLTNRNNYPKEERDYLASVITLSVGSTAHRMCGLARDQYADRFNEVVQRLRWDSDHALDLLIRRGNILAEIESGPLRTLEAVVGLMRRIGSAKRSELTKELAERVSDWRREVDMLKRD